MKKSLLLIISVLSTAIAFAQEVVTIDGIEYYLNSGKAVVRQQDQSLSGDIVIPETVSYNGTDFVVTSIDFAAFIGTDITSIVLPNSITSLGDRCFYGCKSLTSITLPNSITSLGYRSFSGCI